MRLKQLKIEIQAAPPVLNMIDCNQGTCLLEVGQRQTQPMICSGGGALGQGEKRECGAN